MNTSPGATPQDRNLSMGLHTLGRRVRRSGPRAPSGPERSPRTCVEDLDRRVKSPPPRHTSRELYKDNGIHITSNFTGLLVSYKLIVNL